MFKISQSLNVEMFLSKTDPKYNQTKLNYYYYNI